MKSWGRKKIVSYVLILAMTLGQGVPGGWANQASPTEPLPTNAIPSVPVAELVSEQNQIHLPNSSEQNNEIPEFFSDSVLSAVSTTQSETQLLVYQYEDPNLGSIERKAWIHVPASADPTQPKALVLNFHGGTSGAQEQMTATGMNQLADEKGFIVVYPEGYPEGMAKSWNAVLPTAAADLGVDDVGFISFLIEKLKEQYVIDEKRIYAAGISNGAQMAYRVGEELGNQIAAVGVVAGGIGTTDDFMPAQNMPVMVIHGGMDTRIPYEGGIGDGIISFDYLSTETELIPHLLEVNGLSGVETEPYEPFENYEASGEITASSWKQEITNSEVVLIRLEEAGHIWPGGILHQDDPRASVSFSANQALWHFFENHPQMSLADAQISAEAFFTASQDQARSQITALKEEFDLVLALIETPSSSALSLKDLRGLREAIRKQLHDNAQGLRKLRVTYRKVSRHLSRVEMLSEAEELLNVLVDSTERIPSVKETQDLLDRTRQAEGNQQGLVSPYEDSSVPAHAVYWDLSQMVEYLGGFERMEIHRREPLTWDDVYVWDDALQAKRPMTWDEIYAGEAPEKEFQKVAEFSYLTNRYIDTNIQTDYMMFSGYDYQVKIIRQDGSEMIFDQQSAFNQTPLITVNKVNYGSAPLNPENVLVIASDYELMDQPYTSQDAKGMYASICSHQCSDENEYRAAIRNLTSINDEAILDELIEAMELHYRNQDIRRIRRDVMNHSSLTMAEEATVREVSDVIRLLLIQEQTEETMVRQMIGEVEGIASQVLIDELTEWTLERIAARQQMRSDISAMAGGSVDLNELTALAEDLDLVEYYKTQRGIPDENEVRLHTINRRTDDVDVMVERYFKVIYEYLTTTKDDAGKYLIEKITAITSFPGTDERLRIPGGWFLGEGDGVFPLGQFIASVIPRLARGEKIGLNFRTGAMANPEEYFYYRTPNLNLDAGNTYDILRHSLGYTEMLGNLSVSKVTLQDKIKLKAVIDDSIHAERFAAEGNRDPSYYAHLYDLGSRGGGMSSVIQEDDFENLNSSLARYLLEELGYTTYADLNPEPLGFGMWYNRFHPEVEVDNPITDQTLVEDLENGDKVLAGLTGGYWFDHRDFKRVYRYLEGVTSFAPGSYISHWDETGNGREGLRLDGVVSAYNQAFHGLWSEYPVTMGALVYAGIPTAFGALLAPNVSNWNIHIFGDPLYNIGKYILDKVKDVFDALGNWIGTKETIEVGSFGRQVLQVENGTSSGRWDKLSGDRKNEIYVIRDANGKITESKVGVGYENYLEDGSMIFNQLNDMGSYEYDSSGKIVRETKKVWEVDDSGAGHYVTYTRDFIYDDDDRYQGYYSYDESGDLINHVNQ